MVDDSGSCSVAFWDKEAVQLVHKTAVQLKFLLAEVVFLGQGGCPTGA